MRRNATRVSADLFQQALDRGEVLSHSAVPEAQLWAFKREQQRRDIANIEAGLTTNAQMSWFPKDVASNAVAIDSPL